MMKEMKLSEKLAELNAKGQYPGKQEIREAQLLEKELRLFKDLAAAYSEGRVDVVHTTVQVPKPKGSEALSPAEKMHDGLENVVDMEAAQGGCRIGRQEAGTDTRRT